MSMRTSAPEVGNKYYITVTNGGYNDCIQGKVGSTGKPYVCDALANCVGFASGRINEFYHELFGFDGRKFSYLNCNAEDFIDRGLKYGLKLSDVPVKGGIMVWAKGETHNSKDGAGHVAFVEDFNGTTAYTSESGYNGTIFWNSKRTNNNGRWGSGSAYRYLGCLYSEEISNKLREIEEANKPKPEPEVKPEPKPVVQNIVAGDYVLVNGVGTADSFGGGARTRRYENKKMKVIKVISADRKNRYALNQYASGNVGDMTAVTAWFSGKDIKKV